MSQVTAQSHSSCCSKLLNKPTVNRSLSLLFFIINLLFIPGLICGKDYIFSHLLNPPEDLSGAQCSSRMIYWVETFFNIAIATKLTAIFVLFIKCLQSLSISNKCSDLLITTGLCLEWLLPFGFGFKLFWHLCGGVMLLDVTSCVITMNEALNQKKLVQFDGMADFHFDESISLFRFPFSPHWNPLLFLRLVRITWWFCLTLYLFCMIFFILILILCSTHNVQFPLSQPAPLRRLLLELTSENIHDPPALPSQQQDDEENENSEDEARRALPQRRALSLTVFPTSSMNSDNGAERDRSEMGPRRITQRPLTIRPRGLPRKDVNELLEFEYIQLPPQSSSTSPHPNSTPRLNTDFELHNTLPLDSPLQSSDDNHQGSDLHNVNVAEENSPSNNSQFTTDIPNPNFAVSFRTIDPRLNRILREELTYIEFHPKTYSFLLAITYFLVTFTDITSSPECCLEHVGRGRRDDYINLIIYKLINYYHRFFKTITRWRKCLREALGACLQHCSQSERRQREKQTKAKKRAAEEILARKMKMLKEITSVDTLCCICCMDYKSDDVLILLPCRPRHYFHKKCVTEWLERHDTCPLCRSNIAIALDRLRHKKK